MNHARPVLSPLLVGRDDVLGRAEGWIAEANQGRGHVLLIAGDAGVGKTRLVRAIARKAVAAGMRWTGGEIAPQDRQVPLASIMEMARSLRDDAGFGSLGADLLAIQGGDGADNLGSRRIFVRAIVDRILDAIDEPTILHFEDLQWADELSLEVIGDIARFAAERPLLLVGVYRLDEMRGAPLHREW